MPKADKTKFWLVQPTSVCTQATRNSTLHEIRISNLFARNLNADVDKKKTKFTDINFPSHLLNSRPSRSHRRADRTTMLLVAVLLLFLFTEFPQGILGLLSGILEKCFFTRCYNSFGEMMDLLALINAAVGFVLYGLMSKQFRTSFKSVFFNTRLSRLEMTRVTGLNTTCV